MAHDVFVSSASVDKAAAGAVCEALEAAGVRCWIAPRDVAPGARYAEAIVEAIHSARALVLVFSRAAIDSVHVERELDRAVSAGLVILPLRVEELEPSGALEYYLAGRQWFDALSSPLQPHLDRLCEAVRSLLQDAAGAAAHETTRPGAPGAAVVPAPPRRERRVVTVLACDLVDLAALTEGSDPEDVEHLLSDYSRLAREVVGTWDGTVERSTRGALLAVFGAPTAHENDAVRAVLAGLALLEAVEALGRTAVASPQVRIGVSTGEAVVRFDIDPSSGEDFVSGDVVTIATRLLASAPPMGLVVGAVTHALAERAIVFEEIQPLAAEGRAEPMRSWLAKGPVQLVGSLLPETFAAPFVGRKAELAFLESLFEETVASDSAQFALLVGEPGIGKSRLVAEFSNWIFARPEIVVWRQGRCLPYGEGVTFWALSEMLKAEAGILESDEREVVDTKLADIVPAGPDREWFRQRLRALLGLEAPQATREENFAAWRRVLEHFADSSPCVLVFEDLHWADEPLLAFVEHLSEQAAEVPLFLVAATRPELFDAHPGFAASLRRVNRLNLGPLPDADMARLVMQVGPTGDLSEATQAAILGRSCGNPYFAEESVRCLRDGVVPTGDGHAADAQDLPLPDTVQALIAARLGALAFEDRSLLADAAVVGRTFWSGAVVALGDCDAQAVDHTLGELAAKQLVRRVHASSMANESEFVFWHALARDVAYQTLPRLVRARKHASVAAWIEGKAGDRADDLAEILAHHYTTALDLARAAGQVELADSFVDPAVRNLSLAGDRAINLDVAAAERHYARALDLAGAQSAQRPGLLVRWAKALEQGSRFKEAADALEAAIAGLHSAGDVRATATAMMSLARVYVRLGASGAVGLGLEAVALLDEDDPSTEKVEVLTTWHWLLDVCRVDPVAALEVIGLAIDMSEQLGLPDSVHALGCRAWGRCELGDRGGMEDFRRAFAAAQAQGLGKELSRLHMNYAGQLSRIEGPRRSFDACSEGLEFALQRGINGDVLGLRGALVEDLCNLGEWDEALVRAAELAPQLEEAGDVWDLVGLRTEQALLLARRGEASEAKPFLAWLVEKGRESEAPLLAVPSLLAASATHLVLGDKAAALDLLGECQAIPRPPGEPLWVEFVLEGVRTALVAGDGELAARLWKGISPCRPIGLHVQASVGALLAEAQGEPGEAASAFADAASRWHDFGVPYQEGQALLGQGRCLLALGRAPEAAPPLRAAREIFARLEARLALEETDGLLEETGAAKT